MAETQVMIINWNNAEDTIQCIKSIIVLEDIDILILDNASEDNSVENIQKYLDDNFIYHKTVLLSEIGSAEFRVKVLLIRSLTNLGFAGGNNVMLNFAIKFRTYSKYAWLLNNDAIADKDSLNEMVKTMEESDRTAFVGSVILDFGTLGLVQCCGVRYFKYFGVSKLILKGSNWKEMDEKSIPLDKIDFQNGASLLVKLSALNKIKLMDERFFLYFEEQDWQYTAAEWGYKNMLSTKSIVQHKGSVSTNSKKFLFFYYYNKSAIIFSRKHYRFHVTFIATLMLIGITFVRSKLNVKSLKFGLKGILEGWSN